MKIAQCSMVMRSKIRTILYKLQFLVRRILINSKRLLQATWWRSSLSFRVPYRLAAFHWKWPFTSLRDNVFYWTAWLEPKQMLCYSQATNKTIYLYFHLIVQYSTFIAAGQKSDCTMLHYMELGINDRVDIPLIVTIVILYVVRHMVKWCYISLRVLRIFFSEHHQPQQHELEHRCRRQQRVLLTLNWNALNLFSFYILLLVCVCCTFFRLYIFCRSLYPFIRFSRCRMPRKRLLVISTLAVTATAAFLQQSRQIICICVFWPFSHQSGFVSKSGSDMCACVCVFRKLYCCMYMVP